MQESIPYHPLASSMSVRGGRDVGAAARVGGSLYSEVQYIMGNGDMGPHFPVNKQKWLKTLPSHNFVGGR